MTEERAEKIAATLVRQFSKERYFAISLPKFEDLELLSMVLRESFGCTVVWNYQRNKINVYCPEDGLGELASLLGKEPVSA